MARLFEPFWLPYGNVRKSGLPPGGAETEIRKDSIMAAPTDGVTKASVDGKGKGYTGNAAASVNGSMDMGASATFLVELRYSKAQDKVWARARWNNTATHPSGPFLLASNYAGNAQPCGFYVDLQAEFKSASDGSKTWVTLKEWGVKNTTSSTGTYNDSGFFDPDTITHITPYTKTGYFRVRIRTGKFNGYAYGNSSQTYYSPSVKVK